ncbi:hypothetical protein HHK36_032248 [Tetracentron sinense]|uniref:Leucine-rich repeat-containing N-terminal plant-type domain-containing protein n=1 Tax=Tetracentron sinense TaxID=13715 RepID=A0A834Y7K8_TETSI|nr:hypothetical protein HHK36_032248 [Tetracentron sinense]
MEWPLWLWVFLVSVQLLVYGGIGCLDHERIALLELKASLNDPDGSSLPSWDGEESDCCEWESLECNNKTRQVIQLSLDGTVGSWNMNASLFLPFEELRSLNLSSNMMSSWAENEGFGRLSRLRKLEVLDLSLNSFNNSILPSLNALSSLKTLSLGSNLLEGSAHIQELAALNNLEVLDLSNNIVDGFITIQGLKMLSKLKVLDLHDNYLNTSILQSLGALSSLKKLHLGGDKNSGCDKILGGNNMHGSITIEELDSLSNLEVLDLSCARLNQSFLHNVGIMTSLRALSLSGNELNGTLPTQGLCKLKNLQELDLSDNGFEGILPSCLGNLTSLRVLDLSKNQFSGNISSTLITSFPSLEYLSLSYNLFQRLAPFSSFANHSKLEVFELVSNYNGLVMESETQTWVPKFQLKILRLSNFSLSESHIPSFLYNQNDLRVLDLSHNKLKGKFPTWLLYNNTRLEVLYLKNNSFKGYFHLPSRPNTDLAALDISNNRFRGQIPTRISVLFPNLMFLNMSTNSFESTIPPSFGDMSQLFFLDLSNNSFSGGIPEHLVMGCSSLKFFKLSNNNLHGQMFPKFSNLTSLMLLYLDGNHFTGNIPDSLSNSSSLERLDISDNSISGRIPGWMGNFLVLDALLMPKNYLEGPIPAEFCMLDNLRSLDLSKNNLSGSIPSCFSPQVVLHVHLQENRLTGPMTKAFSKSTTLVTLDLRNNHLTGRIPNWIGGLSSLSILLLKGNYLEGKIPSQICELSHITIMDLSHNSLSGPIPSCLNKIRFRIGFRSGKFSLQSYFTDIVGFPSYSYPSQDLELSQALADRYPVTYEQAQVEFTTKKRSDHYKGYFLYLMTGIDLSRNKLTGHIPPEIGNLSRIHGLNLSYNSLTGPIPATFSNLKQIESLDLSYNNLTGEIPSQLTELTDLAIFTVAHNNLSGRTPERKAQFATFEERSYEGNPLLCGLPLQKNCNPTVTQSFNGEEEENGFMDMAIFYASFAASYIMVLIGLAAILYINPNWRRAWFHRIDVCIIPCYYFVLDNLPTLSTQKNVLRKREVLDLSSNYFDNSNLPSLSALSSLMTLSLGSNILEGSAHIQELAALKTLEMLNLSLKMLSRLKVLDVHYNDLNTSILQSLGAHSSLKKLYLGGNNLNGSITTEDLDSLSNLEVLDFSYALLNQSFLHTVWVMTSLRALSLCGNELNGTLPAQGYLHLPSRPNTDLAALDISNNRFRGQIPTSISILFPNLMVLNMSRNSFEEHLKGKHNSQSLMKANPLLFGLPLQKNCTPTVTRSINEEEEEDGFMDMAVFYASFAVSYIIVLIGFVAIIYINPYWRYTWFHHIHVSIITCYYFVLDNLPTLSNLKMCKPHA